MIFVRAVRRGFKVARFVEPVMTLDAFALKPHGPQFRKIRSDRVPEPLATCLMAVQPDSVRMLTRTGLLVVVVGRVGLAAAFTASHLRVTRPTIESASPTRMMKTPQSPLFIRATYREARTAPERPQGAGRIRTLL